MIAISECKYQALLFRCSKDMLVQKKSKTNAGLFKLASPVNLFSTSSSHSSCRGVGDISARFFGSANMPSEKRALDTSDPGRSSNYKRSKRDDRPRDWRVAHLNDGRHRRYHDSPSRDRSLDKERDRDMSHRDRHFPSAGRRFEKNASPLLRDDSSPKGAPSFTKPPPTGPKAVVAQSTTIQHVSSDEREEGE